jgi:MEMO1 family protein
MRIIQNKVISIIFGIIILCSDCNLKGGNPPIDQQVDRQPAVAGQFYPGDKEALMDSLKQMFQRATPKRSSNPVLAIIAPHAGYVFSGDVAASSYNQVEKKHYKTIIIIGSSHHALYDGASIYTQGNFITPLGTVKVDRALGQKLIKENNCFTNDPAPHANEHCIEVQLPFLQYIFGEDINLLPVLIGTQSPETCEKIAKALKPYFETENLFIISTDFSHYPGYYDAQTCDRLTAQAIMTNSPKNLIKTLSKVESSGLPNLQTALCGWTSVLTLVNITQNIPDLTFVPITAKNSGDTYFGDKKSVVGYYSLVVTSRDVSKANSNNFLTAEEKKQLLQLARSTIKSYIQNHGTPVQNKSDMSPGLLATCGAFVTLKKQGELRGCIGIFSTDKPLYQTVQEMAIAASTEDPRFNPVAKDEIDKLELEISVLTPLQKIKSIDEIILGKHGIYIKKGLHSGTFLPQVATETGWTKDEFLGHCARDKAGIGWNEWKDADIYIYEAIVFSEQNFK